MTFSSYFFFFFLKTEKKETRDGSSPSELLLEEDSLDDDPEKKTLTMLECQMIKPSAVNGNTLGSKKITGLIMLYLLFK